MQDKLRKDIGRALKALRKDKGLTAYRVAKQGDIRIDQVKIVESGDTNYTINILLGYIRGCGMRMNFENFEK